jgi:hypothetical protein
MFAITRPRRPHREADDLPPRASRDRPLPPSPPRTARRTHRRCKCPVLRSAGGHPGDVWRRTSTPPPAPALLRRPASRRPASRRARPPCRRGHARRSSPLVERRQQRIEGPVKRLPYLRRTGARQVARELGRGPPGGVCPYRAGRDPGLVQPLKRLCVLDRAVTHGHESRLQTQMRVERSPHRRLSTEIRLHQWRFAVCVCGRRLVVVLGLLVGARPPHPRRRSQRAAGEKLGDRQRYRTSMLISALPTAHPSLALGVAVVFLPGRLRLLQFGKRLPHRGRTGPPGTMSTAASPASGG